MAYHNPQAEAAPTSPSGNPDVLDINTGLILTPDQRVRVFVSSTLQELASERAAVRQAISQLHLIPVMFEMGARPHPPRSLYRAYLEQSDIFVGIYWQRYGWIAPDMEISGLEDEFNLSGNRPKLIYIKGPAPEREPRLQEMINRLEQGGDASYKYFSTPDELKDLLQNDLAILLTESFEIAQLTQRGARPLPPLPSEAAALAEDKQALAPRAQVEPAPSGPPAEIPNNLPVVRGVLVGRADEMDAARALLLRDDAGLVTFTGPGGSGKTRLALELGAHLAEEKVEQFQDGIFFVTLASVRDSSLVAPTIAQTIGMPETRGHSLAESLIARLRDKKMLLVLDNFEQVVDAAPLIVELLENCPALKVLVTSRTPLHLRGEKELPIPPLELPDHENLRDLVRLSHYEAVELFIQRAASIKPDFVITNENAPAIVDIVERLDGLPLAIELAAARVKILPPRAMLARLGSRLEFLTGGARDLPTRQQTLRNTIGWSYDLLNNTARMLFRRLGVFVGGWTLEAAEAVCNLECEFGEDLLDELGMLVDNNLVKQIEMPNGEPRFLMLQTIREYALETLSLAAGSGSTEGAAVRRSHAEYYLRLALEAAPYLTSGERAPWLERLDTEDENLRAAIEWSLQSTDHEEREIGLRLVGALPWYWYMRGRISEARNWLSKVLEHTADMGRTLARAQGLSAAGGHAWAYGDYPAARSYLDECISIFEELGARYHVGRMHLFRTLLDLVQGHYQEADEYAQVAIDIATEVGDDWSHAFALRLQGDAAGMLHDFPRAHAIYNESTALLRKVRDPWLEGLHLQALAALYIREGSYDLARSCYLRSLDLVRDLGDNWSYGISLMGLANAEMHKGNHDRARQLLEESLPVWRHLGDWVGITMYLSLSGALEVEQGRPERAARLFGAAENLFKSLGYLPYAVAPGELDGQIQAGRAQAGDEKWQAAWQEGKAMTPEQAIVYAQQRGTA